MISKRILLALAGLLSSNLYAQQQVQPAQPFMFLVSPMNAEQASTTLNYSGSMGQRAEGPFGYDGFNQQASLNAYLGKRFTFYGSMALGFANGGGTQTAQQAELIRNFIGGKTSRGAAVGFGLGVSRDWDNVKSALSRITLGYTTKALRLSGNMLFEKAFASNRDKIDFTTSVGFQHRIKGGLFAGFELLAEDLEGLWEKDEAEGGTKMLVGPSLHFLPANSRFSFSASGGPVFFATKSTAFSSGALRDIGRSVENGYSIKAGISFNLR